MTRIINERNWQRLNNMLNASRGKVVIGGERDLADLYLAKEMAFSRGFCNNQRRENAGNHHN